MPRGTTRRRVLQAILSTGTAVAAPGVTTVTSGTATNQETIGDWPMFGHDAANTGHAPDETAPTTDVDVRWRLRTGFAVRSSPAVVDGTVFVGSGGVIAADAASGEEEWRFGTGDEVYSSPAVVDGTVYVGSNDNNVYALDAGTGEEQWRFRTNNNVRSSPAVVDGTVYVGSNDNNLYAIDAASGEQQWRFQTDERVERSPAVVDGTVYVGSFDQIVYALDAATGAEQWRFETSAFIRSSPAVADGTVYVGSGDNNVYALDAATGEEQWRFQTKWVTSSPAVADGTVYVGSNDNNVYALDAATGEEQWHFKTGTNVRSSPAVVDGTLFIGSDDDNVYALDAATGTEQWRFQTDNLVQSSPAVVDGTVYVGSSDDTLYALSPQTDTPSPTATSTGTETVTQSATVQPTPTRTERTETSKPAPAPTAQTATPTETLTAAQGDGQQDGRAVLPVVIGVLALGGLGGIGAWLVSRRDDDEDGEPSPAAEGTDGTGGSPSSGAGPAGGTADTGNDGGPTGVGGDSASSPADATAARTAEDTPTEGDDELDSDLTDIEDAQTAPRTEAELATLSRDALAEAETLVADCLPTGPAATALAEARSHHADGAYDRALKRATQARDLAESERAQLETVRESDREADADIEALRAKTTEYGLDVDVTMAYEDLTDGPAPTAATQGTRPPETVPPAPDLSLAYDAIHRGQPLGSGGSADVFEATVDTPDGALTIALKEPRFETDLDPTVVDEFEREADTWNRLDSHDNIVGVLDWGTAPHPWIAMEYMDAGPITTVAGQLSPRRAIWTLLAVVRGVYHAHQRGVAHLDLKPGNVLLRTTGGTTWPVPKVGDWGLAKVLLEHTRSVKGYTPLYAAPEQVDADRFGTPDHQTDIYQLGAVGYVLATGRPPFTGEAAEVVYDILESDPPAPTTHAPGLPAGLDEILQKALAKDRTDRYENILYLRDDLQALYDAL